MWYFYKDGSGQAKSFDHSQTTLIATVRLLLQKSLSGCVDGSSNQIHIKALLAVFEEQTIDLKKLLNHITVLRNTTDSIDLIKKLRELSSLFYTLNLTSEEFEDVIDDIHWYVFHPKPGQSPYKTERMTELYHLLVGRRYRFYKIGDTSQQKDEVSPKLAELLADKKFCWSFLGKSDAKQLLERCQGLFKPYASTSVAKVSSTMVAAPRRHADDFFSL